MSHRKWKVVGADKELASVLSEKLNIDHLLAYIMVSRGMDNELELTEFFSDSFRLSSPHSILDMDRAEKRINLAIDRGERICIYGDYDCDGVTSTALLYTFLESMGADVTYYIPNRVTDGYGMNIQAIDYIKSINTDLIITVDNGISSNKEADYIYSLGMELVITDHHQIGETLPRAEAVVNPHRQDGELGFTDWAGVGVAFKLACALYDGDVFDLIEQYSDLVAIGTIGDVVPLVGENRSIVKAGLEQINANTRIGINALKSEVGCSEKMSSGDVAFQLCPRINAAGRMGDADKAVELLISEDYDDALFKASQLNKENSRRHETERSISEDINEKIKRNPKLIDNRLIIVAGKNYHKGIIGIAAAHLVELYGKPSIVIGIDENGEATGSARSIEGFNIFDAIESVSDMLSHFGGHPLAAGMGFDANRLDEFCERLQSYAEEKFPIMPMQTLTLDCKLSPFYMTTELVDNIAKLEPFGASNPQPVFGIYNMTIAQITSIGDGKHIKLEVKRNNKSFRVVKFRTTVDEFPYKVGDTVDLAVRLSKNFYKNRYYLSIQAVDIRKNGIDDEKYFAEKSDYELYLLGKSAKYKFYPDREICSLVYKYLKSNNGWNYSVDDLYFNLQNNLTYAQLQFSLEAFEQAGLISRGKRITINSINGKAVLEDTQILKSLRERNSFE